MLGYVGTFFILAVIAAFLGFGGLAISYAGIAKLLAMIFMVLFFASLLYGLINWRQSTSH